MRPLPFFAPFPPLLQRKAVLFPFLFYYIHLEIDSGRLDLA